MNRYNNNSGADIDIVSTTGSATDIVTLNEAKNYLRVTNTEDDTLITTMISNAVLQAEKYLNSDILAKQRRMYFSQLNEPINLMYAPVATVDSVTVDGEAQTVDQSYEVRGLDNPQICLTNYQAEKVQITYTTRGYNSTANVDQIKQGVLALVAWLYYRGEAEMPTNWKSWLSPFKVFGYYGTR